MTKKVTSKIGWITSVLVGLSLLCSAYLLQTQEEDHTTAFLPLSKIEYFDSDLLENEAIGKIAGSLKKVLRIPMRSLNGE